MPRFTDTIYAFFVEPDSEGTDAFSYIWGSEFFYAFPPFSVIQLVLRKIKCDNAERVIAITFFITQV